MENSWQVKCGSTLQSSTPSLTSSSSQELRNQTEMNTGYYIYQHGQQDLRTSMLGRVQDPSFPSNSHRMGHVNPGNSFLSLLSGPPSLLQCDFQELSNPKPLGTSGKLMTDNSSVPVNAIGSRIPLTFSGLPSENLSDHNLQHGADFFPTISYRAMTSSNCTSNFVLPDLQSSDLDKAVVHCMVPGNDKVKGSFSLGGEWHSTCPANAHKACGTRVQTSQMKSLEPNSSTSNQSSSFMSGCPRVFCLGTGGYLLLSNTGLLGIVCSCHCFHMSVSKFCEHSGLYGVNPGDAVRMDGGETIAQWRKFYFQKFGIRVPEDQSDWDWPEGLSATAAGLVKSRATTSNISSSFSHLVHSSEGLVKSAQLLDNVGSSKNLVTDQNMVIDAFQNKQKRNLLDNSDILLKGIIGTSQSNVQAVADNQIVECPISRCSTTSKFVGIGSHDGGQSISGYIDSILKNGNSFISYPALQELRTVSKESGFSMVNMQNSVFVGRDAAVSNIELKLGQPYQSSQNTGNSDLSSLGSQLLGTLVNPPKSVFPEQILHNIDNYREKVELGQNLYFATGSSSPNTKRERNHLNLGNCGSGVSNAIDAGRLEKLRGNLVQNPVVSLLTNSKTPPENSMRTKANDNIFTGTQHIMPNMQYSGSFPGENGLERQSQVFELGCHGLTDKGKGVDFISDGYYFVKDSGFRIHKEMEISGTDPHFPEPCGNSCHSHQFSSVALEVPDTRKKCNSYENVPFNGGSGQVDLVNHRSLAVQMGSGRISPSQAVSKGIPTSTYLLDRTSAMSKEEGIGVNGHLLDDNLRLLALRKILDLSKQQNTFSSLGMNKGEGKYDASSYAQHSLAELSVTGEQWHGSGLTIERDVSEAAVKACPSGATCRFIGDKGMNSCCDFLTITQGLSLHPKEMAVQCQLSNDPLRKEQPSMRSDKNIAGSIKHEKCNCRVPCFQQSCNYKVRINCFDRNFEPRVGSFPNALNEQMGTINGEASVIFGSKFAKNQNTPNDKDISLDQRGLERKLHKNIVSHSSQWRDVPSKEKVVFDVMRADCSSNVFDGRGCDVSQHRDISAKCFNGTMHIKESLKENEISNISSGCTAPAVSQVSVEVNNTDSCSADAANSGYVSDLVVDEGSGIDKCWSSDDAHGSERSAEFLGTNSKTILKEPGSSKNLNHQSSRSLLDELKLINSLTWKKGESQIQTGFAILNKDNLPQKFERGLKTGKRKRDFSSLLNCENPKHTGNAELPSCSSKTIQILSMSSQGKTRGACLNQCSSARKLSVLSSARKLPRKRDLHKLYTDGEEKFVGCAEQDVVADTSENHELSGGKKCKMNYTCTFGQARMQELTHEGTGETKKYNSVGCMKSSSWQLNVCLRKSRPMVCGKYGELSDGKQVGVMSKPAKIISLSRILKVAKRCTLPQNQKPKLTYVRELQETSNDGTDVYCDEFHLVKTEEESTSHTDTDYGSINHDTKERMKNGCSSGDNEFAEELPMLEKERHDKSKKSRGKVHTLVHCQSKLKFKEIRKRSIYELTVNGKNPCTKRFSLLKDSKCFPKMKAGKLLRKDGHRKLELCKVVAEKSPQVQRCSSLLNSDAFCCVCGGSNRDEFNYLLECSQCSIKVHQACYGVSRVPKGLWYCRPCHTNSKDIACVLCGYGGGAMTRALQSRAIVKTLLRAWNIETESRPKSKLSSIKIMQNELSRLHSSGSGHEEGASHCVFETEIIEPLPSTVCKMDPLVNKLKVNNSITVGSLDSTTKQWIHMVCALWTPGTRCPNVDTMSAFDVSGAPRPRTDVVCSICCRPGGSCIQCRVINCSVQFHPWCAHQKGLLQSEVEGVDNENVGFYGRCMLHATHPTCETDCDLADFKTGCSGINEFTCARTEGYKGRKRDGFWPNYYGQSKGKSGCLVPQEQLNAWIHINGQKSCAQGLPKLPVSDVEHDCRKEYARYKQMKGWKHLVVYKSGIHALGLYTSRFISRGEMVVEYVGEIVGLRVADKRENEYQSGRKLQYKSACYFFRIDKEHIIDATCKGGIARFVNHSCLPNCVAKVISVRNDKKVVFFAERDIFPGEEITYDYHFNHEDEGKKIPCFCNSKNCRRYLN